MRTVTLALAAVLLAASCNQADTGIFAGIESEQKVVSLGGMNKYASIFTMAEDTSPADGPTLYAAGGQLLFSKTATASTWTGRQVGGSSAVAAVGAVNNVVYAVAGDQLYLLSAGTWQAQTLGAGLAAANLVPVIDPDGHSVVGLYVVTRNTSTSSYAQVYRIDSTGALNSTAANLTGGTMPSGASSVDIPAPGITSAVTTGTTDILASRSFLFDITTPTATPAVTGYRAPNGPNSEYAGLLYVNTSGGSEQELLLSVSSNSSTGGGIYYATVAPNAGGSTATFHGATNGTGLTYSSKAVSPAEMRLVSGSVWVGTVSGNATYEGNGILQVTGLSSSGSATVSVTPSTSSIVTSSNYTSTYLYIYATPTIFQTSAGSVFLGTAAHGLWKWNSSSKIFEQQ